MFRRWLFRGCLVGSLAVSLFGATPAPQPTPSPDAAAEANFAKAVAVWKARTDVPYVRYGVLVRYLHNGHVFDNWWDAYYRSADAAISLTRLIDVAEDRRRLGGVPFSIFGLKIFDTNPDSEPIRLDDPTIEPSASFGMLGRRRVTVTASERVDASPEPTPSDDASLREIGRTAVSVRTYDIRDVGQATMMGIVTRHLVLQPLFDPKINRLRDVWIDPSTNRTVALRVQGLLNGKPYDGVPWTVRYVLVDGRQYLQQIVADEPLHFGIDTTIPKMEFDFVDYHFPSEVPKFTFDRF